MIPTTATSKSDAAPILTALSELRNTLLRLHSDAPIGGILQIPLSAVVPVAAQPPPIMNERRWRDLYYTLFKGASAETKIPSPDKLDSRAADYRRSGLTPIVVANYEYEALCPGVVALDSADPKIPVTVKTFSS